MLRNDDKCREKIQQLALCRSTWRLHFRYRLLVAGHEPKKMWH